MSVRYDIGMYIRLARALILVAAASLAIGLIVDSFVSLIPNCTIANVRNPGTGFCRLTTETWK